MGFYEDYTGGYAASNDTPYTPAPVSGWGGGPAGQTPGVTYVTNPGGTYTLPAYTPNQYEDPFIGSTAPVPASNVPAYSLNPSGQFVYNPGNTAGISNFYNNSTQTTDPNSMEAKLAALGGQSLLGQSDYGPQQLAYLRERAAAGDQQAIDQLDLAQQQLNWQKAYQGQQIAVSREQQTEAARQFDIQFGTGASNFAKQFGLDQQQQNWLESYQQQQLNQSASQFGQQQGLAQQAQDWTQNYQQQGLDLTKNQQTTDQNNYLANLATNPVNWIQYNQAKGNPSVAQPWMSELGGQQTGQVLGNTGGLAVNQTSQPQPYTGNQNTGYQIQPETFGGSQTPRPYLATASPSSGNVSGQPNSLGLQELMTPSMQTYNSMMPSQQQQYQGYETARTGRTAADVQANLWRFSAPSGGNQGLNYQR